MNAEQAMEPAALEKGAPTAKTPEPVAASAPVKAAKLPSPDQTPTAVLIFSYARIVPFVAMALIVAFASSGVDGVLAAEIGYGAVLLSFLGGARWGVAVKAGGDGVAFKPLALLTLPTFFSWAVLLMAPAVALAALMAGFLLVAMSDRAAARQGLVPAWQSGLDLPLTVLTELALCASLGAVLLA
ncbi:MAG TPA: DUF3429 domain-containing protein [Parvibaculum sp.]